MRSLTEITEILKWARENGALHVKVDDVDVLFPQIPVFHDVQNSAESGTAGAPPIYKSPLDDPDYYTSEVDRWSGFRGTPK